ncbi:MAG: creatininase family protein [Verrucomicrobiota bacterium]|nr:creatininase family protein [Verrucomicrobiota bacterium]
MSEARPYLIAETNWGNLRSGDYELAILPWGATEAHNYHLPYATDNIQLDAIAEGAARIAWDKGARIGVLPCVPFGVNTGQLDIPFCINMNPSTQTAVLADVISSLAGQGIPKLTVLNGHGGNNFRQQLRELQAQFPEVFLSTVDWFNVVEFDEIFDEPGDHADEVETSLMMHIAPHLVLPLDQAGDGSTNAPRIRAFREGWAWSQRDWLKATNDTGSGNPARATVEKGEQLLDALTGKLAEFFVELAASDPGNLYEDPGQ